MLFVATSTSWSSCLCWSEDWSWKINDSWRDGECHDWLYVWVVDGEDGESKFDWRLSRYRRSISWLSADWGSTAQARMIYSLSSLESFLFSWYIFNCSVLIMNHSFPSNNSKLWIKERKRKTSSVMNRSNNREGKYKRVQYFINSFMVLESLFSSIHCVRLWNYCKPVWSDLLF